MSPQCACSIDSEAVFSCTYSALFLSLGKEAVASVEPRNECQTAKGQQLSGGTLASQGRDWLGK